MALLRQRIPTCSAEFRLVYSVRSPGDHVLADASDASDASGASVIPAGHVRAVLHTVNQIVTGDAVSSQ